MQSIGKTTQLLPVLLVFFFYSTFRTHLCFAADTISSGQSLTYNQTLISKGGKFELGFFKQGTSLNYYIGIWYKNVSIQTVVWVANRDAPLTDPISSELKLLDYGNLVLLNESKIEIWSTNLRSNANVSSEAVLGDDGNLVLRTGVTPSDIVWQSIDYPTDTLLPGAKIGYNRITKIQQSLTCWRSPNDPAKGLYSLKLDPDRNEYFIESNQNRLWSSGAWDGQSFSLVPEMALNFNLRFHRNEEESYFTYSFDNTSTLSRLVMDISGQFKQFLWVPVTQKWLLIWSQPRQQCEVSRYCGAFGVCNQMSLPFCKCLDGFEPRSPKDWNLNNFSSGCLRKATLQCGDEDGFLQVPIVNRSDNRRSLHVPNADDCRLSCLNSCSCSAYSFTGSCLLWDGDLFNLQLFQDGDGTILSIQIKFAASKTLNLGGKKQLNAYIIVLIAGSVFISILVCFLFGYKLKQRGKIKSRETSLAEMSLNHATEPGKLELPSFDFNTIVKATNNFSNRLGQGGFGSVYKGKLLDEQEIAVKRLSRSSGQGVQEFKNELILISKLQHRNLVRLLGYCIDREEKMLVYEYMPNKSLDVFLFDPTRQILLDWEKRFNIIDGIARGLMYLHRDSRLKVIHRDLKASNILLDEDMNPKISDFGMARIFGGKQTLANTNRIVGTYGYMSPEYAMEGIFSEKSDVFSFGVLLLEIVSSKKNRKFYFLEESYNLLGHVWQKWNENKDFELMDPTVAESYKLQEFTRCIHIGLLCVQESAYDRPTMSSIVFMLGSEGALPLPKKPAFTIEKAQISDSIFNTSDAISTNSITITNPEGR